MTVILEYIIYKDMCSYSVIKLIYFVILLIVLIFMTSNTGHFGASTVDCMAWQLMVRVEMTVRKKPWIQKYGTDQAEVPVKSKFFLFFFCRFHTLYVCRLCRVYIFGSYSHLAYGNNISSCLIASLLDLLHIRFLEMQLF